MKKDPFILAIDTSCDDTSAAVLKGERVLSSIVSSQIDIHKEWGGVVPHLARRAHEEMIGKVVGKALRVAGVKGTESLDAIAVTYGPGLAPALGVGVVWAKEKASRYGKKLIPVNHMEGHVLSAFLEDRKGRSYSGLEKPEFPALALTASGGHTEIVRVQEIGNYKIIGQTLDDAAGEAFDKVARMLGLGYPGGPAVEQFALGADRTCFSIPRPMEKSVDFNFSFSGLKTACLYQIRELKKEWVEKGFSKIVPAYCASLQEAIVDSLLIKLEKAAKKYEPRMILVGGGVSANNRLRFKFRKAFKEFNIPIYFPRKKFCMDNAAMIALVGVYKWRKKQWLRDPRSLDRSPRLRLEL